MEKCPLHGRESRLQDSRDAGSGGDEGVDETSWASAPQDRDRGWEVSLRLPGPVPGLSPTR